MKKTITIATGVLLLATLALAATILGNNIHSSNFTDNPQNVLSFAPDFATLKFSDSNIVCPVGFQKNGSVCTQSTGALSPSIRGWLIVDFTKDENAVFDVNHLDINHSELNQNCTDCNAASKFEVFTTTDLDSNAVSWTFRRTCTALDNQSEALCTHFFTGLADIEGVLIGRSNYTDAQPDPAVHWLTLTN